MAGKQNISREFLSVKELSAYSGICERTLRDLINASTNPIPAYRFGGSIKIRKSEFDEYAAKYCRIDNGRLDRIVNEMLTDLGVSGKRNKKSGSQKCKAKGWVNKRQLLSQKEMRDMRQNVDWSHKNDDCGSGSRNRLAYRIPYIPVLNPLDSGEQPNVTLPDHTAIRPRASPVR